MRCSAALALATERELSSVPVAEALLGARVAIAELSLFNRKLFTILFFAICILVEKRAHAHQSVTSSCIYYFYNLCSKCTIFMNPFYFIMYILSTLLMSRFAWNTRTLNNRITRALTTVKILKAIMVYREIVL